MIVIVMVLMMIVIAMVLVTIVIAMALVSADDDDCHIPVAAIVMVTMMR